jgi:ATP-binding cassette subfamily F protein 3
MVRDFLINSAKAAVVISHDRAFVDNITIKTIQVTMGRIYDYKAKYSHYLELRKDRRMHQQKAYDDSKNDCR